MNNAFDDLRKLLGLEYESDIRFYANKAEVYEKIQEMSDSGRYSKHEIQELKDYASS